MMQKFKDTRILDVGGQYSRNVHLIEIVTKSSYVIMSWYQSSYQLSFECIY